MTSTPTPPGRTLRLHVEIGGSVRQVTVEPVSVDSSQVRVSWDDTSYVVDAVPRAGGFSLTMPGGSWASREVTCHTVAPGEVMLGLEGLHIRARVGDGRRAQPAGAAGVEGDHVVAAPMPGRVVRVSVEPGDAVTRGQGLAAVEAMKMENELVSPVDGVVSEVRVAVDDTVEAGAVLVVVRAAVSPQVDHD